MKLFGCENISLRDVLRLKHRHSNTPLMILEAADSRADRRQTYTFKVRGMW